MQVWKVIPHHEQPREAFAQFCERGLVAVGWTDIGDLRSRSPSSQRDIAGWIKHAYPHLENRQLGGPSLWNFLRRVQPGDYVLISSKGKRYGVLEIVGDYEFAAESEAVLGYRHTRPAVLTGLDGNKLWAECGAKVAAGHNGMWTVSLLKPSDDAEQRLFSEGRRFSIWSTEIERSPQAREACLRIHGTSCFVCGFSGERMYGSAGEDLIHVHHLTEVSKRAGEHEVDPETDLVPLCPNCHSMAHRRSPPYSVQQLRAMLPEVAARPSSDSPKGK